MWRSQSDLLYMAQEHNHDLVRQAEADRLDRHMNGTLAARLIGWWASRRVNDQTDTGKPVAERPGKTIQPHPVYSRQTTVSI